MNNKLKLSELLAIATWTCTLVESWLLLIKRIPVDVMSISFFVFYLLIAIFASAISSAKKEK